MGRRCTRVTGLPADEAGEDLLPQRARRVVAQAAVDQRQPAPSSSSQRLMWSSANGSGMRSQCTPGATSRDLARRRAAAAKGYSRTQFGAVHAGRIGSVADAGVECGGAAIVADNRSGRHCRPPGHAPWRTSMDPPLGHLASAVPMIDFPQLALRPRRDDRHAARHGARVRRRRDRAARRRDRPHERSSRRTCGGSSARSACSASPSRRSTAAPRMGYLAHIVAMEEISRASASVGPVLRRALQPVREPDPPQRQRRAEAEVPAEADLRRARRRARDERARRGLGRGRHAAARRAPNGDRYVLNGNKMWITNGPDADVLVVYAQDRRRRRPARHHRLPRSRRA